MRSALLSAALAAAPALVSAAGSLGFALGDKNADGTCKFQADWAADFETIQSVSKIVRVYAASDCDTAQYILPAAKAAGFQVILGIWYVPYPHALQALQSPSLSASSLPIQAVKGKNTDIQPQARYRRILRSR